MRKHLGLGAIVVAALVGCASDPKRSNKDDDDGGGAAGGGAGGSSGEPCADYLACAAVAAPSTLPGLIETYGEQGSCWEELDVPTCEAACAAGYEDIAPLAPMAPECGYVPGAGWVGAHFVAVAVPQLAPDQPLSAVLDVVEAGGTCSVHLFYLAAVDRSTLVGEQAIQLDGDCPTVNEPLTLSALLIPGDANPWLASPLELDTMTLAPTGSDPVCGDMDGVVVVPINTEVQGTFALEALDDVISPHTEPPVIDCSGTVAGPPAPPGG
jgi:hypothetical protein